MSLGNVYCPIINNIESLKSLTEIEKSIQKKYRDVLWAPFIKALKDFEMIKDNDVIAVAISGGKDSLLLAKLFQELKRSSKTKFEIKFIAMNPGFNNHNLEKLKSNLDYLNIPCEIYNDNIFEVVDKISKDYPCYLCAKMRRGSLYTKASLLGCNKLALGHHLDDVVETILMSMFYMSKYETMLPKLKADNFDIELIRPLYYIEEKNILKFIRNSGINPMNCGCVVQATKTSSKRYEIKQLINTLEKTNKNIKKNILSSSINVNIEKILAFKYKKDKIKYSDNYKINLLK